MKSKIILVVGCVFLLTLVVIGIVIQNQPVTANEIGFYLLDGYAFEQGDPYSEESAIRLAEKISSLQASCFPENPVYVAIIPEKEYYADHRAPEKLDFDALTAKVKENLSDAEFIELADVLALESYYYTDHHWKQDALFPVVERLGAHMQFVVFPEKFDPETFDAFQGTCASYIDLEGKTETMTWLFDDAIENAEVSYYDHPETKAVYNTAHLSENPYDLFLEGATPLLTIDNPQCATGRTLILFRDSFGSSLAPLLINQYSRIVMVDIRYMISDLLPQMVDFTDAEVLFLYSASVANESRVLR